MSVKTQCRMDIPRGIRYRLRVQHPEALRTIRNLGPELAKSAAEDVLLAHANAADLAPSQLEKLAQTYNMVRQLSHIEEAPDRGSSCHQIDTGKLVQTYTSGGSKSASTPLPVSFTSPSHDASVDLMSALRRDMYPVTKAASVTAVVEIPAPTPVRFTEDQIKIAAWEAKADLTALADGIIKSANVDGRYLLLAEAEHDAMRQINADVVKQAMDMLSGYAANQRVSRLVARHEGPVRPLAFPITTSLSDQLVKLAEAFVVSDSLQKLAVQMKDIGPGVEVTADPTGALSMVDAMDEPKVEPEVEPEVEPAAATGEGPQPVPSKKKETDDEKESKPEKGGGGGKEKGNESSKSAPAGKHWLSALVGGAMKPVNAASKVVSSVAGAAQGSVKTVTDKERVNKGQIAADTAVADIRRSILVRRLAANDPVLRDVPLQQVLSAYNAIAESNPEVASNPQRVLLAIREAASYEGVTMDAQKTLGDVRGAAAKTDEQEANNTRRRYLA